MRDRVCSSCSDTREFDTALVLDTIEEREPEMEAAA